MMRIGWVVSLVVSVLFAGPVSAQIVVPDALTASEHTNWRAIGRVDVRIGNRGSSCTGTLVTPTTVLTAAHCVVSDKSGTFAKPSQVTFSTGFFRNRAAARVRAAAIELPRNWQLKPEMSRRDIWADLAIIRLAQPVENVRPIPVARRGLTREFRVLGYRFDRPDRMTDYRRCFLLRGGGRALLLSCGVASGTSGAPVLFQTSSGWATAGVVSSGNEFEVIAAPVSPDLVR